MSTLGELIKLAREERLTDTGKSWTQQKLADEVGITKQWVSRIERGDDSPSLSLLLNIHKNLIGKDSQDSQEILSIWLLKLVEMQVRDEGLNTQDKNEAQAAIEKAVARLIQPTTLYRRSLQRTLEHFPSAFEPLTIVCGDRRESNPITRGDIFAHSVSITDLTFLPKLGLPQSGNITIRSDKLFVLMDEDYLKQEFGKTNLLIIGSPAVNFAARVINNHSVFRFNLPSWLKEKEEQIRTLNEHNESGKQLLSLKELNDQQNLRIFWQLAQHPEDAELINSDSALSQENQKVHEELVKRLLRTDKIEASQMNHVRQLARMVLHILGEGGAAKSLMNEFRRPGLMDFSDVTIHATSQRLDNDFALISLAPNPYAVNQDYVCIMVAGIHGPGTAHALRALAEDDFRDHPFGGIIEVELDLYKDWPTRFQKARWRWQTKRYNADKLLTNLKRALTQSPKERHRVFEHLTAEEIKHCIGFVEHITDESTSSTAS